MLSTRQVLKLLRDRNPDKVITEERIRRALRKEKLPPPVQFAGRLAWSKADVVRLAKVLGLD